MNIVKKLGWAWQILIIIGLIAGCQKFKKKPNTAEQDYQTFCSSCHGQQMQAFVDREWKFGNTKEELTHTISNGLPELGMPAWGQAFSPEQTENLVEYILNGIENVDSYLPPKADLVSDTFQTDQFAFHLDTLIGGLYSVWGFDFLPDGKIILTGKAGQMFVVDENRDSISLSGVPMVNDRSQGGLLDVIVHPDFESNKWIYISYSGYKDDKGLTTTIVDRLELKGDQLINRKTMLEALPYSNDKGHYGSRLAFDKDGYLYISVGERRGRDVNPQSLQNHLGKIHRIHDDGRIPDDNPFYTTEGAVKSIFAYGIRNPQGLAINPKTGALWENEHGPRGGDEINIIEGGNNYGWPVISYGLNYDGTTFTNLLEKDGMEQPEFYWVPSIAPSGMAFVTSDKYPGWKGNLLVGALRFKYLNMCILDENEKIVGEQKFMQNIGRVRTIKQGPDGFIYVSVERPGMLFKLIPIKENI